MTSPGFVVCHGWSYGASDLQPFVKKLRVRWPHAPIVEVSLGHDDTTPTSRAALQAKLSEHPDTRWIAIGHSWGFAWLLQQPMHWAAAVSLNGFTRFCRKTGAATGTAARLVDAMLDRLQQAPEATLTEFWSRVGNVARQRRHHHGARLREDLLAMRDADLALPACPVLALASRNDVIVPPALSEACFTAPNVKLQWFESDHALPMHAPQECVHVIWDFIALLDPVARRFDRHAQEYESAATVQRQAAGAFAQWIAATAEELHLAAPAKIAELGCGTGFLTRHLLNEYPSARVLATDLAPAMVAQCTHQLAGDPAVAGRLRTEVCDARTVEWHSLGAAPDWTVSAMCFQWFDDLPGVIARLSSQSRVLAFSLMLEGSFTEWRAAHERVHAACGLRALPSWERVNAALRELDQNGETGSPLVMQCRRVQMTERMPDGLSFARALRAIGADAAAPGHQPLNLRPALRPVVRTLASGFTANYDIGFFLLTRSVEI
jgi:malonyl-CoA O-methyltransferase